MQKQREYKLSATFWLALDYPCLRYEYPLGDDYDSPAQPIGTVPHTQRPLVRWTCPYSNDPLESHFLLLLFPEQLANPNLLVVGTT